MPVKMLSVAKSRLVDADAAPAELALAFFTDTLTAVAATAAVTDIVVVTADAQVRRIAEEAGARVVDDAEHPGINAAAAAGAACATAGNGIAVLVSDLPCLSPGALSTALDLAACHPTCFVADADGTGTTMWFTRVDAPVITRFGPDSRAAHADAGAVDLVDRHPEHVDTLAPARLDIDTSSALERAVTTGVGTATANALAGAPR